jgi:hypothetical protein
MVQVSARSINQPPITERHIPCQSAASMHVRPARNSAEACGRFKSSASGKTAVPLLMSQRLVGPSMNGTADSIWRSKQTRCRYVSRKIGTLIAMLIPIEQCDRTAKSNAIEPQRHRGTEYTEMRTTLSSGCSCGYRPAQHSLSVPSVSSVVCPQFESLKDVSSPPGISSARGPAKLLGRGFHEH